MKSAVPVLDVFYIAMNQAEIKEVKQVQPEFAELGTAIVKTVLLPVAGPFVSIAVQLGMGALREGIIPLKHLAEENRFYIIKTPEELMQFENANGNAWITNEKSLKRRQYYIRHPKAAKRNLLIEAGRFYDYIEKEQKDELINYIMSHCPVKSIQINRTEIVETSGKAKSKIKAADVSVGVDYSEARSNYFYWNSPNGAAPVKTRDEYVWIDEFIMQSISALTEGGKMTETFENDCTFGLNASEAKTVGLDLSKHKKYSYTVHVEC